MAESKINLPVLSIDKPYERYRIELDVWRSITTIQKNKVASVIALSLPDNYSSRIKDNVYMSTLKDTN